MAAIGSKRQRFLGDGNDSMRVTSLVRSLVELPYVAKDGTRVHPSPGSVASSRVAVQTDHDASTCVAFVASGGGVWRHAVPFAGGEDVAEGKERAQAATVLDGVTTRVCAVRHRHEIQSIALYDPRTYHGSSDVVANGEDPTRLASADASGRCVVTLMRRDGVATQTPTQWFLNPAPEPPDSVGVPGWTGVCFDPNAPDVVAVARRHAKTIDVFGDRLVRSMRAPLAPSALCFVERDRTFSKTVRMRTKEISMLAVARGARCRCGTRAPRRGAWCGESRCATAGRACSRRRRREPGRERRRRRRSRSSSRGTVRGVRGRRAGVHVIDVDRWSVIKRWPGAMKFDIAARRVAASPDHCVAGWITSCCAGAGRAVRWRAIRVQGGLEVARRGRRERRAGRGHRRRLVRAGTSSRASSGRRTAKTRKPERNAREANRV